MPDVSLQQVPGGLWPGGADPVAGRAGDQAWVPGRAPVSLVRPLRASAARSSQYLVPAARHGCQLRLSTCVNGLHTRVRPTASIIEAGHRLVCGHSWTIGRTGAFLLDARRLALRRCWLPLHLSRGRRYSCQNSPDRRSRKSGRCGPRLSASVDNSPKCAVAGYLSVPEILDVRHLRGAHWRVSVSMWRWNCAPVPMSRLMPACPPPC
jgi:hypothetical protein